MGDGTVAGGAVALVGMVGGEVFGRAAAEALRGADLVIGSSRHVSASGLRSSVARLDLEGGLDAALAAASEAAATGRRVCFLVSGDPGFFGLARLASARLPAGALRIHPAPSSVSLAFARIGRNWDDAVVVSAHGRDAAAVRVALEAAGHEPKVAVLCSPDHPPEVVGTLLVGAGCGPREVTVVSRLGEPGEAVWAGDLAGLAAGAFDPLSVVLLCARGAGGAVSGATAVWGRPESAYAHRNGMITKAEIRAVALGKLGLPSAGVLWDVGAGSGSVSAEAAGLAPGLRVFAVERGDCTHLRANLDGTGVEIVAGAAPEVLSSLPDPDRVFVGGGGLDVLDACVARLRPGGTVVATYASPGRAATAWERLGSMVQLSVSRAVAAGEGLRLAAENPVFVCWGPAR